ncbi:MAG: hypothetical protein ABMB14_15200 [Myxococcota bacterium]
MTDDPDRPGGAPDPGTNPGTNPGADPGADRTPGNPGDALPVDVVTRHPAIRGIGRDEPDQRRAEAFAKDLARWLFGRSRAELGPLARVVTVVAQRELRPTRQICRERPLMAVEAAARATAVLWPLLRDAADGPGEEQPEPEGDGGGGGGDEDPDSDDVPEDQDGDDEEDDEDEDEDDEEDPLQALLGDLADGDDPDLDALIERLSGAMGGGADPAEAAAEALGQVTEAAAEGAIETDRVARQLERFLPGIGWSSSPGQLEVALLDRLDQLSRLLQDLAALDDAASF